MKNNVLRFEKSIKEQILYVSTFNPTFHYSDQTHQFNHREFSASTIAFNLSNKKS
jgi:hypothetical protein